MTTYAIGGQSSGDFKETSARVQLLHVVTRNSVGVLTPDAFTQANPPVVTGGVSSTLAGITKVGVLGGSIAFTRYDYGNGYHGGPKLISAAYDALLKPLGIFLNDAIGNAFENTPGVASGKGPYVCGNGSTVAVSIYETKIQSGGFGPLSPGYIPGQKLYASVNGMLTNLEADAYEYRVAGNPPATVMGIVKVAPDSNSSLLVLDLRV
jgi:hypothetical protein